MRQVYGDGPERRGEKLNPRMVTVTKGWSEAYGLFLKGEADMVLSYSTSPAYHVGVEKKTNYRAASFAEGHYLHVELAGLTRTAKEPELARRFLSFVLSEPFQSAIPEGNWMFPAKAPPAGLPASFRGPDPALQGPPLHARGGSAGPPSVHGRMAERHRALTGVPDREALADGSVVALAILLLIGGGFAALFSAAGEGQACRRSAPI